ncbi:MAG: caspase family protein [Pirellulales bacterium]|nr:caspase family protein [Pirellulales bacterium]
MELTLPQPSKLLSATVLAMVLMGLAPGAMRAAPPTVARVPRTPPNGTCDLEPPYQAVRATSVPRNAVAEPARVAPLAGRQWSPQKTWVFVVGILQWQDARLASFPQQDRRDADLVAVFQAAGVPADHICWLCDQQATLRQIDVSLHEMLARTQAGDMLVVYYAGHGTRNLRDEAFFVPYDGVSGDQGTFWGVSDLLDDIEATFRGSLALLMADCCHSGGLAVEVNRRQPRVGYACLASANAHSASTGNWTFTDCVLDGLRGSAYMDEDGDGFVELGELGNHVFAEMAFVEEQMAAFLTSAGFDPSLAVARAQGERIHGPVRVWAEENGRWYKARVLAEGADSCYVHYIGYSSDWDAWIGCQRVRPYSPQGLEAGTAVRVEWQGRWYGARVLRSYLGLHLVRYDGYGAEWDEWVPPRRLAQQ